MLDKKIETKKINYKEKNGIPIPYGEKSYIFNIPVIINKNDCLLNPNKNLRYKQRWKSIESDVSDKQTTEPKATTEERENNKKYELP